MGFFKKAFLVSRPLFFMIQKCKRTIFKQKRFKIKKMLRNLFPFRYFFFKKFVRLHSGRNFYLRKITTTNTFFFRFGSFCLTKRRGSQIHGRNKKKKLEAKRKKEALIKLKLERRRKQETAKLQKAMALKKKKNKV